jgi:hypothetical protein
MTNSHMNRNVWWCILLLTVAVAFPLGLSAQTDSAETGFYYTVQKGDTLWDISQKFFKDPELWPDLWGRNQELSNPHWIYPGDLLHIYMRGGKIYVEKVDQRPAPTAPTPEPEPAPQVEPPYFFYSSIEKVGFIRKPAVVASGLVFKIQGEKVIAGKGDILYIRQNNGALPVGSRFILYRTFGPVADPTNKKATKGTQHYFTGVAEITRQEDGYVLAEVIESYRTIQVDDRAMPYEKKSPKIYLPENPPEISGTILRSEERSEIMGEFSIAFIDKGSQDGVMEGQQFCVYNQDQLKLNARDKEMTALPPEKVGTLLVLHTEQNTATVLVLASSAEFSPGTKFTTTLN